MKKIYLSIFALFVVASIHAQTCVRDSSLLMDTLFVSPRPYTASYPVYALAPACIGQPYTQSVTIKVPATFVYLGTPIPLTSASIATTGAVTGLPAGISYSCDPPNCVFNANTLGCILLHGTPNNPAQAPDTTNLVINATISAFGTGIPIAFPGPIAPGNYYFVLAQAGACISGTYEQNSGIYSMKNTPNPFTGLTSIQVDAKVSGDFNFDVFDLLGQRLYSQQVSLMSGENQFSFDAGNLANGTYIYVLSNGQGKAASRMVIQNN
jgi:hypothetical protein